MIKEISKFNALMLYNEDGNKYRRNGISIDVNSTKKWWKDGKLHRDNGPAVEYSTGSKVWWVNGDLHRVDGPARIWYWKNKCWQQEWWLMDYNLGKYTFNNWILRIKRVYDNFDR